MSDIDWSKPQPGAEPPQTATTEPIDWSKPQPGAEALSGPAETPATAVDWSKPQTQGTVTDVVEGAPTPILTAPDGNVYVVDEYGMPGTVPSDQAGNFQLATQADLDSFQYAGRPIETFARTAPNAALLGIPEAVIGGDYAKESEKLREHNSGAALAAEATGAFLPAIVTGGSTLPGVAAKTMIRGANMVSRVGLPASEVIMGGTRSALRGVVSHGLNMPVLRAISEAGVAGSSTVVRNVADDVAQNKPITLESAVDGALTSTLLAGALGVGIGKLEQKAGSQIIFNLVGDDRVPLVYTRGASSIAASARSAERGVAEVLSDAARSGDNVFAAAGREMEPNGLLKTVTDWSTTPETVERAAAELAPQARQAINEVNSSLDDVVRTLDANPVKATADDVSHATDALTTARRDFANAANDPGYAGSDVLEGLETRMRTALAEELKAPRNVSLDDLIKQGLSNAPPEMAARAIARSINMFDDAARSVDDPVISTMLAGQKDALGRGLSDPIKLLGSINEGNAYARQLDALTPGLRRADDASFDAAKRFLGSNDPRLTDLMSSYLTARANTLQLAGRQLPESMDNLLTNKAMMLHQLDALSKKQSAMTDMLTGLVKSPGAYAGGALGGMTGIPGAANLGAVVGKKVEDFAMTRFVKPMVNRMVRSQEARDAVSKGVMKGAQTGLRALRAVGQGANQSTTTEGSQRSRGVTARMSSKEASKVVAHLAETLDPGTLRGATNEVQLETLRQTGEGQIADAIKSVQQRQSQAIQAKKSELLGDGPDPSDPLSHLLPQPIDPYKEHQFNGYVQGATEPHAVIARLNKGLATADEMQGIKDVYPDMFDEVIRNIGDGLANLKQLPEPGYLAYLSAVTGADLVPGTLVASQQRYVDEQQKKQEQQGGSVNKGVAPKSSEQAGYGMSTT